MWVRAGRNGLSASVRAGRAFSPPGGHGCIACLNAANWAAQSWLSTSTRCLFRRPLSSNISTLCPSSSFGIRNRDRASLLFISSRRLLLPSAIGNGDSSKGIESSRRSSTLEHFTSEPIPSIVDSARKELVNHELERVKRARNRRNSTRERLEAERQRQTGTRVTWRECCALLKSLTPSHDPKHVLYKVKGSRDALDALLRGVKQVPHIGIARGSVGEGLARGVVTLSGPDGGLVRIIESVIGLRVAFSNKQPRVLHVHNNGKNQEDADKSSLVVEPNHRDNLLAAARSMLEWESLPPNIREAVEAMPTTWTDGNFVKFVKDFSRLDLPATNSVFWNRGPSIDFIRKLLSELLLNSRPGVGPAAVTEAINQLLQFLVWHTDWHHALALFRVMPSFGCTPDIHTYATLIEASAKAGEIKAVLRWLQRMQEDCVQPNLAVWAAVYSIIPDEDSRQAFVLDTLQYNLIHTEADAALMIKRVARHRAGAFVEGGGQPRDFYDSLHITFGQSKLSSAAYRVILDELALRGRMKNAIAFLENLRKDSFYQPIALDVNTLLSHCAAQGNVGTAVALVHRATQDWKIELDQQTYVRLFRCFHWARRYHCLRVVWKAACLGAMTDLQMRNIVLKSLYYARELKADGKEFGSMGRSQQWMATMGHFLCRTQPLVPARSRNGSETPSRVDSQHTHELPVDSTSSFEPSDPSDDISNDHEPLDNQNPQYIDSTPPTDTPAISQKTTRAQQPHPVQTLASNIDLATTYRLTSDLATLLVEAYRMDAPLAHGIGRQTVKDTQWLDTLGTLDMSVETIPDSQSERSSVG